MVVFDSAASTRHLCPFEAGGNPFRTTAVNEKIIVRCIRADTSRFKTVVGAEKPGMQTWPGVGPTKKKPRLTPIDVSHWRVYPALVMPLKSTFVVRKLPVVTPFLVLPGT